MKQAEAACERTDSRSVALLKDIMPTIEICPCVHCEEDARKSCALSIVQWRSDGAYWAPWRRNASGPSMADGFYAERADAHAFGPQHCARIGHVYFVVTALSPEENANVIASLKLHAKNKDQKKGQQ